MTSRDHVAVHNAERAMPSATFQVPTSQVETLRVLAGSLHLSQSHLARLALDAAFRRWGVSNPTTGSSGTSTNAIATSPGNSRLPLHVRRAVGTMPSLRPRETTPADRRAHLSNSPTDRVGNA